MLALIRMATCGGCGGRRKMVVPAAVVVRIETLEEREGGR